MVRGLLGVLGEAPFLIDLLAGAGLGALVGYAAAERSVHIGSRHDPQTVVRRWTLAIALAFVLFGFVLEVTCGS